MNTFLALDDTYARYASARFAVLPIPYDATTSYVSGTRFGPAAIITASQQVEWFDEELETQCHRVGIATVEAVEPNAAGPAAMQEDVYRAARRIVRDGKFPLALGGEHGISSAVVRAVMQKHRTVSVLQIDAHADLRDTYQGSPYSHACVMRRIHELGAKIVPVGIRSVSRRERAFVKRARIDVVSARACADGDAWLDRVLGALGEVVYVTIDIDGFDPAYAPGTGTPEPGGLDWYQVVGLLRRVAEKKRVVGADIVEVLPLPGQVVTEFLAARLAYKLICYVATAGGTRSPG
ncbi:MAG: agmatinase [Phycisphaerae bacterium]